MSLGFKTTRAKGKGPSMLFVTHYELTGERSKEKTQALMEVFGERGPGKGTLAHYVYADGGAGFVISDESGMDESYEIALAYSEYMTFTTRPIITIDEAVPQIGKWLAN